MQRRPSMMIIGASSSIILHSGKTRPIQISVSHKGWHSCRELRCCWICPVFRMNIPGRDTSDGKLTGHEVVVTRAQKLAVKRAEVDSRVSLSLLLLLCEWQFVIARFCLTSNCSSTQPSTTASWLTCYLLPSHSDDKPLRRITTHSVYHLLLTTLQIYTPGILD